MKGKRTANVMISIYPRSIIYREGLTTASYRLGVILANLTLG